MKTQQLQLEERLGQEGWRVVDRETPLYWWAEEVWIIESIWRPAGHRLWITFIVDPWPGSEGNRVWAVAVTAAAPTELPQVKASAVPIRHGWASYVNELLGQISRLREQAVGTEGAG